MCLLIYLSDVSNDPGREHPKYSLLDRRKDEEQRDRDRHPSWSTQPVHRRNKTQITMFIWYLHQIYNCTKVKCPQTFPSTSPSLRQCVLGRLGVSNQKLGTMWHEEARLSNPQAGPELHKNEPLKGTSACKPSEDRAWCLVERKMWQCHSWASVSWVSIQLQPWQGCT